jgi:hypothetical protein
MLSKKLILLSFAMLMLGSFASGMIKKTTPEPGTPNKLVLEPGKDPQTVFLPFEYKHLNSIERKKTTWVPERFYTVIEPGSDKLALAGPLHPCLFVALKNETNNRIIVFHKSYANSLDALIKIAKMELYFKGQDKILGIIFSCKTTPKSEVMFMQQRGGLDHFGEVKYVKDRLVSQFNIIDRNQISAKLFTSSMQDGALGDYEFAELSVIISADFKPYSICMMHEGFFRYLNGNDLSKYDLSTRKCLFNGIQSEIARGLIFKAFDDVDDEILNTFDKAPFAKI